MEGKRDNAFQQALRCLPPLRASQLTALAEQDAAEEVRFRAGWPPAVKTMCGERQLTLPPVSAEELREMLSRAARYSVHSYAESLRQGFVTLAGGHRLGLCGTVASENGQVVGVRGLSSVNLRIARQAEGIAEKVTGWIGEEPLRSVLLVSPPGFGKTTLLREWVRAVSERGNTVAVADERGEVAALSDGVPQFALGRCTDVLEGCAKKQAAMILLKTMSPALIAFDEITAPEDVEAVSLAAHCGVAVIATAHARDICDLRKRPIYRNLLALHLFEKAVVICCQDGKRTYRMEKLEESSC
ncbi:MAG: stage III sporulation protein AB [Agathobaculum sp.]|jgi:stage III sporulation protein AA|uniref:stage III sporulation protein AB n=1 Tax=Agathobaculum sp. TaxID=2048138 RepID=UPI003D8F5A3B